MIITEDKLRKLVRQALLNERRMTLNMSNDSRMFTSVRGQYVHKPTKYDPVIRKITKIVDKNKESFISPVLDFLKGVFVKDAAGNKRAVAEKGRKDEFMSTIAGNYVSFATAYSRTGDVSKALLDAEMSSLPDGSDLDGAKPSPQKTLSRDRATGEVSIATHGQDGDVDMISVGFKGLNANGQTLRGDFKLSDLFRDVLNGSKLLKPGAGRDWIRNKKPEDQLEWMQVKTLQGLLISAGYAKGLFTDTDGDYGGKTKEAVKRMQKDLGLAVDGTVGQQTAAALNPKITGKNIPITGAGVLTDEIRQTLGL